LTTYRDGSAVSGSSLCEVAHRTSESGPTRTEGRRRPPAAHWGSADLPAETSHSTVRLPCHNHRAENGKSGGRGAGGITPTSGRLDNNDASIGGGSARRSSKRCPLRMVTWGCISARRRAAALHRRLALSKATKASVYLPMVRPLCIEAPLGPSEQPSFNFAYAGRTT
jgi:hypothetical protein